MVFDHRHLFGHPGVRHHRLLGQQRERLALP
jgi:hypothetical protein